MYRETHEHHEILRPKPYLTCSANIFTLATLQPRSHRSCTIDGGTRIRSTSLTVVIGLIPVEMNSNESVFQIYCLPQLRPDLGLGNLPWSEWVIYVRVSGATPSLSSFLAADAQLLEYALCHALGGADLQLERYAANGVFTLDTSR